MISNQVKQLSQQLGVTRTYILAVLDGQAGQVAPWLATAIEEARDTDLGSDYRITTPQRRRRAARAARARASR